MNHIRGMNMRVLNSYSEWWKQRQKVGKTRDDHNDDETTDGESSGGDVPMTECDTEEERHITGEDEHHKDLAKWDKLEAEESQLRHDHDNIDEADGENNPDDEEEDRLRFEHDIVEEAETHNFPGRRSRVNNSDRARPRRGPPYEGLRQRRRRQPRRWSWRGKIFGTASERMIDYIAIDSTSAPRAREGYTCTPHWTTWDHRLLGQVIDLHDDSWNLEARMRRRGPKPIGWTLQEQHAAAFEQEANDIYRRWSMTWSLQDITTEMQNLTQYGKPWQAAYIKARCSHTEDHIKKLISEAETTNERRRWYKHLWTRRKQIAAEKQNAQMSHILKNLHAGGWGKRNLAQKVKGMTMLQIDATTTTTDASCLAAHATKYYEELFSPERKRSAACCRPHTRPQSNRWRMSQRSTCRPL